MRCASLKRRSKRGNVHIQTSAKWRVKKRSAALRPRSEIRIGIPRVLNIWSTHRFWIALLEALGVDPRNIVFSSETSEEQGREYGRGRGAVDCCYPVKCMDRKSVV